MPYLVIPAEWIEAGKPTREEIFQYIRDNQESFNADIEALKQTSQVDMIDFTYAGAIEQFSANLPKLNERSPIFKAPSTIDITSLVVTLLKPSSSGVLSVDIEKSSDNGVNWSSLLNTPVTVTGLTAGSLSGSVSFISAATQIVLQNELLRVNITGVQAGQGAFHVSVYGEVS